MVVLPSVSQLVHYRFAASSNIPAILWSFVSISLYFARAHSAPCARWCSPSVFMCSRLFCLCFCLLFCCFPILLPCHPFVCCASDVLHECPVGVLSVLMRSFGYAYCLSQCAHWSYALIGHCKWFSLQRALSTSCQRASSVHEAAMACKACSRL
jgi:hypothetical protein